MNQGEREKRTLTRDTALLKEFDSSKDPNLLVLYHHLRDRAFDCFNAAEYTTQMIKYIANNINPVEVVSRSMNGHDYFLVCLRSTEQSANPLCEMAFQMQRQFTGYSMLVKKRCFHCNKSEGAKKCSGCQVACFCSSACLKANWKVHKKLCTKINVATVSLDKSVLNIEL